MGNLFFFELKSRIKGIIGWSLGLIAFGGLYISVYPEVAAQFRSLNDLAIYQAMGVELATFEGYLSSVVLGFLPILLGIYALLMGTGTLSGEEDAGTLELLMAKPLSRSQIVTVKAAAIALILGVILLVTALGDALIFAAVKSAMDVDTPLTSLDLARVILSAFPICLSLGMIALFLGTLMPSRRPASALTGLVLVAGYFGENFSAMAESLEPWKPIFLFSYYDSSSKVFSEGVAAGDLAVLLGLSAAAFLLALLCFQKRNVTTASWVWKRGRLPG
ncbi:MAG: ABC transporter permease subunit [Spirochaetales bacterium]|nr:ABC transporter permease subunit [Spirochaetales bacterium]